MSWAKQKNEYARDAFTIVELLIVIVIIAILAAITIISYVGIQNRAKASAAQTLLSQTVSKVKLYAVDHSDTYPSSLSAAGITNTDGLQYSSSSSSPSTFCITATSQNVSYYQSSTTTAPTAGACPGHGVNGGGVVVNLALSPRGQSTKYAWKSRYSMSAQSISGASDGPSLGLNDYFRETQGATPVTAGGRGIDHYVNLDLASSDTVGVVPVDASSQYTASVYARSSVANSQVYIACEVYDGSGSWLTGRYVGSYVNYSSPNQWIRLSVSFTAGASGYLACTTRFQASATWTAGSTIDGTGLMITKGPTLYSYNDPITNSSWAWTGTSNNSTSTGPAP